MKSSQIYENGNISIVGPFNQLIFCKNEPLEGFKGQMWIQPILSLIYVFLDLILSLSNYNKWSRHKIYENGNISIVGPIQLIDILEKYTTRGF